MKKRRRAPLGQVFLTDRRIERRIVDALSLGPDDAVMEIGAGPGNMTERLAALAAKVWAVEVDPRLAAALRRKFAGDRGVEVVEADILQLPIDALAVAAGRQRIHVFGNLPYYITSPCLIHLFQYHSRINEMVVMVQLEVARRIVAEPGSPDYGLLSVTCQYYTKAKLLFTIPPQAFRPRPSVDSAVVRLTVLPQREALGIDDEPAFWKWTRAAFAQKRKTLVNNWKGLGSAERLRAAMEQMGINPRARAEALSVAQLAALQRVMARPDESEPLALVPTGH